MISNLKRFWIFSVLLVLPTVTVLPIVPAVMAQETTLVLCKGSRHTVRVYERDRQIKLRTFNHRSKRIGLNTGARSIPRIEGVDYVNVQGKPSVKVFAAADRKTCSLAIGSAAPEIGTLLFVGSGFKPIKDFDGQVEGVDPDDLVGKEWLLEDLQGAGVIDNVQSTLTFGAEGRLSGFGGCNRYSGNYRLTGTQLNIGTLVATRRGCAPALLNQEAKFLTALEKATRIARKGAFLLIETAGADQPLKFTQLQRSSK